MNFPRFKGPAQPSFRQPSPSSTKPSSTPGTEEPNRIPAPGPSGPAPPVLTRPRAGALGGNPPLAHGYASGQTVNGGPMIIQRRDPVEDAAMQQPTDSLNLGQLKAAATAMQPKQKVQQFTYRYDDTDTLMNELDEFYSYEDVPHVAKAPEVFAEDFKGSWTETSQQKRKEYLVIQLDYLESASRPVRRGAQQRLLYLLQGCFAETTGPEMQLHWVIENAKTLRSVDGVGSLVTALRDANRRYTTLAEKSSGKPNSSASDGPLLHPIDPTDDNSVELIDVLGMLYFVVEVFRTDETFGEELMTMATPLPLLLFQMVAGLKDRLPKMYPVKKVLLLLWKTLLASLGGMKDVEKAKALTRDQAGLPPVNKDFFTKASPIDITNWRRDMSVKYTTFHPSSTSDEKLAEGIKPIPPRPNYHSTEIPSAETHRTRPLAPPQQVAPVQPGVPGTPAPSPPLIGPNGQQQQFGQPGKPKKQQFQTDPNRPFIFPFSHSTPHYSSSSSSSSASSSRSNLTAFDQSGPSGLVPYAIAEADKLFSRHAYVSLGLYQLWEARDECMREERGLGKRGLIGFDELSFEDEDAADVEARRLEWKLEEEEMEAVSRGDKEGAKRAKERLVAAKRLRRVDVIYKSTLPSMQSCVIVLLKFLLATVTGPGAAHMASQGNAVPPGFQSPTQEVPQPELERPPPTKAEIDVARHREITSKAVSAILILLLKWFKASHVLKFHYLAQLLFDSNCLLLVLKMFGLSDVWQTVTVKNECEDLNFFRYCHLNCSKSPPRPEDSILQKPTSPKAPDTDGDIEYISEYSWRNFFSTINFLKILQKMTKHRTHRTYMLHQYKSSQILKRMLRANQPMMQLQVLKLIKSQMPWCGRKWRQTNMKTITSIYLNCRPDLKDDWLAGTDQDTEIDDALPQEYALRSLVAFYNRQNYSLHSHTTHHRSNSVSGMTLEDPALNPQHSDSHIRRSTSSSHSDRDIFPPRSTSTDGGYDPDVMFEFWRTEYDELLSEVFGEGEESHDVWPGLEMGHTHEENEPNGRIARVPGAAGRDDPAWIRLDEIMRSRNGGDDDVISDSESVVTVGELGEEATAMGTIELSEVGEFSRQQMEEPSLGKNTWEHMSPTTLSRLPPSPLEQRRRSSASRDPSTVGGRRRSSSSSSPLRAVFRTDQPSSPRLEHLGIPGDPLSLGQDDDPFDDEDDEDIDMRGPMPIAQGTPDQRERLGAVDEVEYAYGE